MMPEHMETQPDKEEDEQVTYDGENLVVTPEEEPADQELEVEEEDEYVPPTFGEAVDHTVNSLKESGSKLKRAFFGPAWKAVSTYVTGATDAMDELSDGFAGKKKKRDE